MDEVLTAPAVFGDASYGCLRMKLLPAAKVSVATNGDAIGDCFRIKRFAKAKSLHEVLLRLCATETAYACRLRKEGEIAAAIRVQLS